MGHKVRNFFVHFVHGKKIGDLAAHGMSASPRASVNACPPRILGEANFGWSGAALVFLAEQSQFLLEIKQLLTEQSQF